jgi:phosphatidylserine decarboxylase
MLCIGIFFDLLSNTSAGHDLFRKTKFNLAVKDLLDYRGRYLTDPNDDSNSSLTENDDGWFSPQVLAILESDGRGTFNDTYVCPDPDAVNRGFATFDAFFTRQLQPGARPVPVPENKALVHSACESSLYRIAYNVKKHDRFWLKGQPYSLYDMLNHDEELADRLVDGTVFQAYLSSTDYHRWHAPVEGVIIKTVLIPGTYYAVLPDEGSNENDPSLPPGEPFDAIVRSQAWLTMVATRAVVYIHADNPDIGLMCFIAVGMWEVSTCEITVTMGQRVKVGDELGTFHIGGSTYVMIFRSETAITFADNVKVNGHIKVNSIVARVAEAAY